MRRFTRILFALLITLLASCSTGEEKNNTSDGEKSPKQEKEQTVGVDKGLLNVEITLPASMFEGEDIDTVIADAKKEGVTEVKKMKTVLSLIKCLNLNIKK